MRNEIWQDPNAAYYTQEKRFLFHMIPDGAGLALDLGCGAGRFGKALLESGKVRALVGVEIFEPAAEAARQYYQKVHVGDIEAMELDYERCFDLVLCGDVLEHLKEPLKVLQQAHRWLKDSGHIVCCVPNVRYWRVWRDLVWRGRWDYASEGIMDQTHLRFFTTLSFRTMLVKAGFTPVREDMRIADGPKQQLFNRLTRGRFKEFLGFQMMFLARKA